MSIDSLTGAAQSAAQAIASRTSSAGSGASLLLAAKDRAATEPQINQLLKSSRSQESAERKEAARQKLERLKAQIQALRMMAGGDLKAVARRAAGLARELAAAAREYSSAGGTDAAATIAPGALPTATGATSAETAGAEKAGADTQGAQAQAAAAAQEAQSVESTTQDADTGAEVAAEETATGESESEEQATAAVPEEKPRVAGTNPEDEAFVRELRRLMNELKVVVRGAQMRMKAEDKDDGAQKDIQDAQKALGEVERVANDITAGSMGGVFGAVNVVV